MIQCDIFTLKKIADDDSLKIKHNQLLVVLFVPFCVDRGVSGGILAVCRKR